MPGDNTHDIPDLGISTRAGKKDNDLNSAIDFDEGLD